MSWETYTFDLMVRYYHNDPAIPSKYFRKFLHVGEDTFEGIYTKREFQEVIETELLRITSEIFNEYLKVAPQPLKKNIDVGARMLVLKNTLGFEKKYESASRQIIDLKDFERNVALRTYEAVEQVFEQIVGLMDHPDVVAQSKTAKELSEALRVPYTPDNLKGGGPLHVEPLKADKCECGAEKTNQPGHSSWCPKYRS